MLQIILYVNITTAVNSDPHYQFVGDLAYKFLVNRIITIRLLFRVSCGCLNDDEISQSYETRPGYQFQGYLLAISSKSNKGNVALLFRVSNSCLHDDN